MEKRSRRATAPLWVAAAIAVVFIVYILLMNQAKNIDMPTDDASPEQVVEVYLQALDAHDCDTVQALTTAPKGETWCASVAHIDNAQVANHNVEDPAWSGRTAPDEVVNVPVTFDVGWRVFHGDISMPPGYTDWGYLLVRSSPTQPWRIFAEGNG